MNNLSILESAIEANIFIQLGAVFLISSVPFLEGSTASILIISAFPAVPTLIVVRLGTCCLLWLIIVLYEKISYTRNAKQKEGNSVKRMKLARKLFKKYGLPGILYSVRLVLGIISGQLFRF